jgi:organic radical activating enzyme
MKNYKQRVEQLVHQNVIDFSFINIKEISPVKDVKYVTWVLNNVCPYSCIYCPEIVHNGKIKSYFDWKAYEEFLDYLFNCWQDSTIIFAITGGEPTVHPYFEKIVDMISNNGHVFGLTTNLSRSFNFWKVICNKLEYISTSFHPTYVNTDKKQFEFIDKLNLVSKTSSTEVRVMMYPDLWKECISFIEKLKDNFIGEYVIPVTILEDFGVNEKYVDINYTNEQLEWINNFNYSNPERPDGLEIIKDHMKHQSYFKSEHNVQFLPKNVQQIANDKVTNFKGWSCNIGIDSLYVDFDGGIKGGNCLEGGYIGDIISKINWPAEPLICESTYCHCVTDIKIKKKATENSDMISVSSKLFMDYTGEYKDGIPMGQGTTTFHDGEKYIGEYKDGKTDGYGKFIWPDGKIYEGKWKEGKLGGTVIGIQGTLIYPGSTKYVGKFEDNKFHGKGILTSVDGDSYNGKFKNGKYDGLGTLITSDEEYTGEWKSGQKYGQGEIKYSNGTRYKGEWKFGLQEGLGVLTFSNDEKIEGIFKNGMIDEGEFKDGEKIKGIFKNGKIVK